MICHSYVSLQECKGKKWSLEILCILILGKQKNERSCLLDVVFRKVDAYEPVLGVRRQFPKSQHLIPHLQNVNGKNKSLAIGTNLDNKIMKIPQTIRGDRDFSTAISVPLIAIMKNKLEKKGQESLQGDEKSTPWSPLVRTYRKPASGIHQPTLWVLGGSSSKVSKIRLNTCCLIKKCISQVTIATSDLSRSVSQKFQKHRCSWGDLCLVQLETAKQLGKYTSTQKLPPKPMKNV